MMVLTRRRFSKDGIFGELSWNGTLIAVTLEHSYDGVPKLPEGRYLCVRGPHRLHGMTEDFTTFQVTDVPGHTGILFHWGNYNHDSDGCVLVGEALGGNMITNSRTAFARFMATLGGIENFDLTVQKRF